MTKTLLRVYDKNDQYSMRGECYFVVLPGTYDELSVEEYYTLLSQITSMSWQKYTSVAVGTAEIEESELYWSEITGYELHEVKIDVARVQDIKKYKLPESFLWA